jgi:hypothetical protein
MRASILTPSHDGRAREVIALDVPAPAAVAHHQQLNLPRIVSVRAWLRPRDAASPDLAEIRIPGGGLAHVRVELLTLLDEGAEIIPFPGRRVRP